MPIKPQRTTDLLSPQTAQPQSPLRRLFSLANHTEDAVLVLVLAMMIVLAVGQIILRNLFDSGIDWADSLVRVLVLWVGLAGAMVATRQRNHISLDVLSRYLPDRIRCMAELTTDLFTTFICAVLAYHSARFVHMEYIDGTLAFASVPSWVCQLILPIAFGIITLRTLVQALILAWSLWRDRKV